ncbi:MAG TPA: type II toxin-antitoxin system RelE/ParE family toxin [Candidatus Paceibacterota bacterium]|nr:type II toxin-antitoxin system RelE/ParE family toxin [Candidatus Paceibacterota bacterium]
MYYLSYHKDIVSDLKKIGKREALIIKQALEKKLLVDPILFGKPLRYSLQGLRSLRVGNYRVVYLINDEKIFIAAIVHRSKVYDKSEKRYGQL